VTCDLPFTIPQDPITGKFLHEWAQWSTLSVTKGTLAGRRLSLLITGYADVKEILDQILTGASLLQNYANDVVAALLDACVVKGVRQPVIASESGRALASHSAVLVFDVLNDSENAESDALRNLQVLEENKAPGLGSIKQGWPPKTDGLATNGLQPARRDPGQYLLSTFYQVFATIDQSNFQVCWNQPIVHALWKQ
jgi:hypothetical protein